MPYDENGEWRSSPVDINGEGYAHANAGDTESAAAQRILPRSGTMRRAVYDALEKMPDTDEGISIRTGIRHYTAAPRRKELVDMGLVADSGTRRATTTGSPAIVWRVVA